MDGSKTRRELEEMQFVKVVRNHGGDLETAIRNPSLVSSHLLAKRLISAGAHDLLLSPNQKRSVVVAEAINSVCAVLKTSPNPRKAMTNFCEALEKSGEPAVVNVVAEMRNEANIEQPQGCYTEFNANMQINMKTKGNV